jgi:serine phosphatase RsbU (regulator of sigma subunit)
VVGDVSGKGVAAALMMAQALSMLRLMVHPGMSPGAVLARWNGRICRRTVRGMFITAILGRIRPEQGVVEFAAAGHVGPLLRQASLEIRVPAIAAAPPLGIVSDLEFPVNQIKLLPGDQAVFYTDGLVESVNFAREPFSLDRVRALLARPYHRGGAEIIDALTRAEANHRGEVPPHDDLTILTIGLR